MKEPKTRMTEQDKKDWDELYQFVKLKVLGYDENQKIPNYLALRLKGMLTNKFIENNKQKATSNYSYKVVLNTFKFCMPDIRRALSTNRFVDEQHKINYIMKIVDGHLNDVYMRMKNTEKVKEEVANADIDVLVYDGAKYKPNKNKKYKFEDLW